LGWTGPAFHKPIGSRTNRKVNKVEILVHTYPVRVQRGQDSIGNLFKDESEIETELIQFLSSKKRLGQKTNPRKSEIGKRGFLAGSKPAPV
jgi:hypothetical protein